MSDSQPPSQGLFCCERYQNLACNGACKTHPPSNTVSIQCISLPNESVVISGEVFDRLASLSHENIILRGEIEALRHDMERSMANHVADLNSAHEPCPTHATEHRLRNELPCPWCVIDELKRNRDSAAPPCTECEGSGESGHTWHDGTQYSTKEPPCHVCGGSGGATQPPGACKCVWYAPVPKEWKFCPSCSGAVPTKGDSHG